MIVNAQRVPRDVVVIAASAGALVPLMDLLKALGSELVMAMAIVMHRNRFVEGNLLKLLRRSAGVPVIEPAEGELFVRGSVFLAPRDRHLLLDHGTFRLSRGPEQHYLRPAADLLFESAAAAYGRRVLGVVLSGAGYDGAVGCLAIKAEGGLVVTQDPGDAEMPFMPLHALRMDHVDAKLPLARLPGAIAALAAGQSIAV